MSQCVTLYIIKSRVVYNEAVCVAIKAQCREDHWKNIKLGKSLSGSIKFHETDAMQKVHRDITDITRVMRVAFKSVLDQRVGEVSNPKIKFQCHNCRRWGHIRMSFP